MWSKTKKALESRLVDGLKDRVYYTFAKHTYHDNCWDYVYPIFYIRVDKETWFATNDKWFETAFQYGNSHTSCRFHNYFALDKKAREYGIIMATKEMGTVGFMP